MPKLAPIINSAETIAAAFQPSIDAAFTELEQAFGFWPIVKAPLGGARTKAEQAHLVAIGQSDTMNSDHREDAVDRAAVDIDNHRDFRNVDQSRFLSILEAHGWQNMTNSGEAFPTEPWHFAKHGSATADNGATPIDNTTHQQQEDDMGSTRVFQMTNNGVDASDWSRIGPDVLPVGTFPGGYEATADIKIARLWVAQYGLDASAPIKRERAAYIAQQQFGATEYQLHKAEDIARAKAGATLAKS